MFNCCSHGTLLHFGLQSSRLNICYYHQDLHQELLHLNSRCRRRHNPRALLLIAAATRNDGTVSVTRFSAIHFRG